MAKTLTTTLHGLGGLRFMGETPDGQRVMIDNEKVARTGMSPMQLVLNAAGACAAMAVSHMLAKRRLAVNSYTIELVGERVDDVPSPFTRIKARDVLDVPGLTREQAERLVDLATNKYCSVGASLKAEFEYEVVLLHDEEAAARQAQAAEQPARGLPR